METKQLDALRSRVMSKLRQHHDNRLQWIARSKREDKTTFVEEVMARAILNLPERVPPFRSAVDRDHFFTFHPFETVQHFRGKIVAFGNMQGVCSRSSWQFMTELAIYQIAQCVTGEWMEILTALDERKTTANTK